jgi:hypothetical protein
MRGCFFEGAPQVLPIGKIANALWSAIKTVLLYFSKATDHDDAAAALSLAYILASTLFLRGWSEGIFIIVIHVDLLVTGEGHNNIRLHRSHLPVGQERRSVKERDGIKIGE